MLESSHLSKIFTVHESLHEILEFKFRNTGKEYLKRGNSGWYKDVSLRIVESHIPEMSRQVGLRHSVKGKHPSSDHRRPKSSSFNSLMLKSVCEMVVTLAASTMLKMLQCSCPFYSNPELRKMMQNLEFHCLRTPPMKTGTLTTMSNEKLKCSGKWP